MDDEALVFGDRIKKVLGTTLDEVASRIFPYTEQGRNTAPDEAFTDLVDHLKSQDVSNADRCPYTHPKVDPVYGCAWGVGAHCTEFQCNKDLPGGAPNGKYDPLHEEEKRIV